MQADSSRACNCTNRGRRVPVQGTSTTRALPPRGFTLSSKTNLHPWKPLKRNFTTVEGSRREPAFISDSPIVRASRCRLQEALTPSTNMMHLCAMCINHCTTRLRSICQPRYIDIYSVSLSVQISQQNLRAAMFSTKAFTILALVALSTSSVSARQLLQTGTCPLPADSNPDLSGLVGPCGKCAILVSRAAWRPCARFGSINFRTTQHVAWVPAPAHCTTPGCSQPPTPRVALALIHKACSSCITACCSR